MLLDFYQLLEMHYSYVSFVIIFHFIIYGFEKFARRRD